MLKRTWLDGDPERKLSFSYCLSHLELNERIDEAVGLAVDDPAIPVPRPCSISLTYNRFTIADNAREKKHSRGRAQGQPNRRDAYVRHAAAGWFDGHPVDVRGRPGAMSDMTTSLGLRP